MQVAAIEFGKFHLLEEVGRGPISTIHRAVLRGLQGFERQVAIKRILPELGQQPNFVQAFIDQAKLLALLDHTNIVKIYDFGRVDDRYFIAMEYVEDSEPLEACSGRAMPPEDAAHLMVQVCSGLQYAHERGLVHGDLNPSNILLCGHSVKLIDFGIAQLERVALADQPPKRKWGYLSPEQVEGSPPTPWSDIFSAGAILWELLTGEPLFEGFAPHVTLGNILKAAVPSIAEYQTELQDAQRFDAICQRALSRQPSERYHDAGEMADDLITVLEGSRAGLCLLYGGGTLARAARPMARVLEEPAEARQLDRQPEAIEAEAEQSEAASATVAEEEVSGLETLFDEDDSAKLALADEAEPEQLESQAVGNTGPQLPEPSLESQEVGNTGPQLIDKQQEATSEVDPLELPFEQLDDVKTEVRGPNGIESVLQEREDARTQVSARRREGRSKRLPTGPQLPAHDPRRRDTRDGHDDASPARARAMSSMMRTMAERSRLHAEQSQRRRSTIFVLCGMLLVSLATNVVLLLRLDGQASPKVSPAAVVKPDVGSVVAPALGPKPDAAPVVVEPVVKPADSATRAKAHDATVPAAPKQLDTKAAPDAATPRRRVDRHNRTAADTVIADTREAVRTARLGQQLQRFLQLCVLSQTGLRLGLHVGSAGKVRRVFIPPREGDSQQSQCARNNLLKAQLNIVLPRQTYMEWRFAQSSARLIRIKPSK